MTRALLMKKIFRDLNRQRLGLVSALALVLSGSLTYVVMQSMFVLTDMSVEQTIEDEGMADLSVLTYGSDPALVDSIRNLQEVEVANTRYDVSGIVELADGRRLSGDLFGVNPSTMPDIFKLNLREGSYLDPEDNMTALAEIHFANAQDVEINDTVIVELFGVRTPLRIVGIVWTIEYLVPATNPRQLIPQHGSSAPLFIDISVLSNLASQPGMVNEFSVIFHEGVDHETATEKVLEVLQGEEIYFIFRGSDLLGEMAGIAELQMGQEMTLIMSAIVLLTSTVVVYVVVRRVIEDQRQSLGVLVSLGYHPRTIESGFIFVFVGLTFISAIIATLIATPVTVWLMVALFADWNMAVVSGPVPPDVFIFGSLSAPVTALLASISPICRISKLEPIRVLRGLEYDPQPTERTLLEAIGERITKVSYSFRYAARSLSKQKMRTAMLCFGILIGSFSVMNTVLYIDSIYLSVDVHMDAYSSWDLVVDMRNPVPSSELETILDSLKVETYERYFKVSYFSELAGTQHPFEILFYESSGTLQSFEMEEGREILTNNEAVVETRIAEARGVTVGNQLDISIAGTTEAFTVVGIAKSIFRSVFIDYSKAPAPDNETLLSGAFVDVSAGTNIESVKSAIAQSDIVESVQTHEEAANGIKEVFRFYDLILWFLIAMCVAIVFLVIWTTTNITTMERMPEFAQLEAIGFDRRNLRNILIGEVFLISIIGTILSIPPSIYLGYVWVPLMSQTLSVMEFYVRLVPMVVSIAIPIVAAVVSVIPLVRVLGRVDLPTILRNRNPQ
ncbi:MAG: ABC transporter permease [Candidatus Thorarchaeota archaeon]